VHYRKIVRRYNLELNPNEKREIGPEIEKNVVEELKMEKDLIKNKDIPKT
jgi:hypothetical protein